jgi:hypothetical protein
LELKEILILIRGEDRGEEGVAVGSPAGIWATARALQRPKIGTSQDPLMEEGIRKD